MYNFSLVHVIGLIIYGFFMEFFGGIVFSQTNNDATIVSLMCP